MCCLCGCEGRHSSFASKLFYLAFFLGAAVLAVILRFTLEGFNLPSWTDWCDGDRCFGVTAAYRVSFCLCVFFLAMTFLTLCLKGVHSAAWVWKSVVFFGLLVVSVFIPNDFFAGYAQAARVGSVFFLIAQILVLVDFAFMAHEYLLAKMQAYTQKCVDEGREEPTICQNSWALLYIGSTLVLALGSFIGCILMFTELRTCGLNTFFISETLIMGIIFAVLSATECVGQGALPPMIFWANATYLCYGAITNNPDAQCNPFAASEDSDAVGSILIGLGIAAFSIAWSTFLNARSAYGAFSYPGSQHQPVVADADDWPDAGAGAAMVNPSSGAEGVAKDEDEAAAAEAVSARQEAGKNYGSLEVEQPGAPPAKAAEEVEKGIWSFHLIMALGGMYLAMLLSNWGNPQDSKDAAGTVNPEISNASMWARIGSQFATYLLYGWIMMAPTCFPNRDFGAHSLGGD